MKLLMFAVIFLLIGAFFIISNGNLHIGDGAQFAKFAGSYYSWMGKIFVNGAKATAYAVKLDWLP